MNKSRVLLVCLLLLLGVGFVAGAKPRIVVLANSIDFELASDFFGFLGNRGIKVIHSTAGDFEQYKEEKFIVILGGHEAYEGVGDIVKWILTPQEMKYIWTQGNRKMYVKTNVWAKGQVVRVIAGSDRYQTKKSHEENKDAVSSEAEEASEPEETPEPTTTAPPTTTPAPTTTPPTTTPPPANVSVEISEVIYDPPGTEPDDEKISLNNTGSAEVDISGWILTDGEGSYTIPDGTIIGPGEVWSVFGSTYNPTGDTGGLYLDNEHDEVILKNGAGKTVDEFSW
ncbi:MAG: lamin tail domain-containing protein [Candidatus Hydrothermarchaeales archaeon]